jgi:antitoxin (DNA-binding transcriptional repressor) of toxin-antitoxin stability system
MPKPTERSCGFRLSDLASLRELFTEWLPLGIQDLPPRSVGPFNPSVVLSHNARVGHTRSHRLTVLGETLTVSHMSAQTATIRELRTDFREVKRKIERHGEVVITDHGEPAYLLKSLPRRPVTSGSLPDYYARLSKRQPRPLSAAATREFWEEERR